MERADAMGDTRHLFQLVKSTGPKKAGVSETINEKDGSLIYSQGRRLDRWAEHFKEQFSWPEVELEFPPTQQQACWDISIDPPTLLEVQRALKSIKRHKAAGPDGITPNCLKDGGNAVLVPL